MKEGILRFWDRRWRALLVIAALAVAAILTVALGRLLVFPPSSQPSALSDNKTRVEIVQGLATTIAILVAGFWSYYVFVRGRNLAPNIQIQLDLRQEVDLPIGKGAVVSVKLKNVGRIEVQKQRCLIAAMPVANNWPNLSPFSRLDSPVDLRHTKTYPVFDGVEWIEPGEEAIEDVLFNLGESNMLKVFVKFSTGRYKWHSTRILDVRALKQEPVKT